MSLIGSNGEPLNPPTITVTEHSTQELEPTVPESTSDVDLVDDEPTPTHTPTFFPAPPVREAAKKTGRAIGKVPLTTTTVKAAPSKRGKSSTKAGSSHQSRGTPRGRGRGAGTKSSSAKKSSLLAQAQENRARSHLQSQSAPPDKSLEELTPTPDNRLYCICKSGYDDARVMIGCDRCDEWFHPRCVSLSDHEVEQIDVYVCPSCRKQNPHLQITRKTICRRQGCFKSSRRQASKYCSDECGVLAMAALVENTNLEKKDLWHVVKDARYPEGAVFDQQGRKVSQSVLWARRKEFSLSLIQDKLDEIERQRQDLHRLLAITDARQDLFELILARLQDPQKLGEMECGWDTRWLWEDSEIQRRLEDGSILESYSGGILSEKSNDQSEPNEQSEPMPSSASTWWCTEGRECQRHQGWIKLIKDDLELERSDQNAAKGELAERERKVRIRIENPDAALPNPPSAPIEPEEQVAVKQLSARRRGAKKSKA